MVATWSRYVCFVQIIQNQWKIALDGNWTCSCGWPASPLTAGYVQHMYSNILCVRACLRACERARAKANSSHSAFIEWLLCGTTFLGCITPCARRSPLLC